MVLSRADYNRALIRRRKYLELLSDFVKTGTIVFIGYSFGDHLVLDIIDDIIEIMPQLLDRHPAATLLIIGDGSPERQRLEGLARKAGVEKHVFFLGKMGHRETMDILRGCDLFIVGSGYEVLPHTIIEA
ncbi:MAG: glycosyltransferase, partial [Candidatus Marinimicrobia bacterium]|nr:glycosyltransferase [Candidatus Neomarinimicrobiota bacterium]